MINSELLLQPHNYPGRLIIVEGIDGSGKSTQIRLVQRWLVSLGYNVFFTEWNSADLVKKTTKKGKKSRSLTPTTFSLLHATDFAHRLVSNILPPLKAGMIVLADRYVYTAYARDHVRGCDRKWIRKVYSFAPKPDIAFYFKVPIEVSLKRITMARQVLKDFEAGMDMKLHPDPMESFRLFQGMILEEYDQMSAENDFCVINATGTISEQQKQVREIVGDRLQRYNRKPRIA
ncbi:MAG: dTMP kinase [Planctomycetia bacterium]|jgi:dTMP kinase|nr:dTMP kinase [Planctomycetia bacterium]MCC7316183.1 dTMP kinase [Planctomycetota bacterium]OQY97346.1 MAG: dTMP kinase [Planctomycetes bacterium UTPLA1]